MNESSIATNVRSIVESGWEGSALTWGVVIRNALVGGPITRSALIGNAKITMNCNINRLRQKSL